jgi:hypothetical protein
MNEFIGFILLMLGLWQIYSTYGYFQDSKKHKNNRRKSFYATYAVFFSALLTVIFIASGFGIMFNIALG